MINNLLTECLACKGTVSRDAVVCPHCGRRWPDGKPAGLKESRPLSIGETAVAVCIGVMLAAAFSLLLWVLFGAIASGFVK